LTDLILNLIQFSTRNKEKQCCSNQRSGSLGVRFWVRHLALRQMISDRMHTAVSARSGNSQPGEFKRSIDTDARHRLQRQSGCLHRDEKKTKRKEAENGATGARRVAPFAVRRRLGRPAKCWSLHDCASSAGPGRSVSGRKSALVTSRGWVCSRVRRLSREAGGGGHHEGCGPREGYTQFFCAAAPQVACPAHSHLSVSMSL
jgi:hypothetical protein